ncbi:MAG: hypothetical protein WD066_13560 [Planctomycetaceae bacterium]
MKAPLLIPVLFAVATAVCWGLYGPVLSAARDADPVVGSVKSVFKPFVAIGIAYLVLAVGGGLIGIVYRGENFQFFHPTTSTATMLAFAAGLVGALGALTLTTAMASGGKPHTVMPIVFGGAVTVSALVSLVRSGIDFRSYPWLWVGIVMMIVSAVVITGNTPHGPAAHAARKPAAQPDSGSPPPPAADAANSAS